MNANHKLTDTIKGRTIKSAAKVSDSSFEIFFDDDSKMQIKTPPGAELQPSDLTDLTVNSVQQHDTVLKLIGANNKQAQIPLNEATSSVMLRDKNNALEYAD